MLPGDIAGKMLKFIADLWIDVIKPHKYVLIYCLDSETHLSAILAHIGLTSHHSPNVVIQSPLNEWTK